MKYIALVIFILITRLSNASPVMYKSYLEVSSEFEALIKKESAVGNLPRIQNKKSSQVFEKLSKSQSVIVSNKYTVDDFGDLINICGKANQFGMAYLLHRMKLIVTKSDPPQVIQMKVTKLMIENSIKYQNELKIFYPFLVDCSAIQASLVEPFWKSLPSDQRTQIRKNGVIKMRTGVFQIYAGVLATLGDSSLKVSFKDSLLKSASNAAPVLAALLPLDVRGVILRMLDQYKETATNNYVKEFENISKAFSRKDCNEICQL